MSNSVGEQLRSARESRHLTLEQVARSTFIKIRFLEALENDRLEELHTSVQARGFLRNYAELLGLNAAALLDIWDGKAGINEPAPAIHSLGGEDDSDINMPSEVGRDARFILAEEFESSTLTAPSGFESNRSEILPVERSSEELFFEIGQILRQRREKLRISHEDIEKFVHIRPKYLQALEEGRIDDLPSTVQGRGMLSNYAHFLEVDHSQLLTLFAEGLELRRQEMSVPVAVDRKREPALAVVQQPAETNGQNPGPIQVSKVKRFLTPDLLIAVPLIIFLLGFAVWAVFEVTSRNQPVHQVEAPNISEVLLVTSAPPTIDPSAVVLEPTSAMAVEATRMSGTLQAGNGLEPTAVQVNSGQPLNINIVVRQNAWLRVTVGKSVVFNGRVTAGNAYPFSGNERIEVLSGNAAALQIYYNGIDLGSLGLKGQVVNLVFTLNGIITPTPQFTPIPSATPQPTLTLQPTATPAAATVTPLIPIQ